jgi:hypothetical protein
MRARILTGASAIVALALAGCAPTTPQAPVASAPSAPVTGAPSTSGAPQAEASKAPATEAPAPLPRPTNEAALPITTVYDLLPEATVDSGGRFAGQVAVPRGTGGQDVVVYRDANSATAMALAPVEQLSDRLALPVVGRSGHFAQVLLPSRIALPGNKAGLPVNGATGWVHLGEVRLIAGIPEAVVDYSAGKITVKSAAGKVLATVPILLDGDDLAVLGRSYFVSSYYNASQRACSETPILAVALQSEEFASFASGVSLVGVHAWSAECRARSLRTQTTSGCVNISNDSMRKLLKYLRPGSPISFQNPRTNP